MADEAAVHGSSRTLITVFVTMHTFAWIGSSLIILTVLLSPNIRRHATWVNLNLSWIIACFFFALLLTTGQLYTTDPNTNVCLVQAAAVNAVTTLTPGTTLALALQLWFSMHSNPDGRDGGNSSTRQFLLVILPYLVPLIELIASLVYGIGHRKEVVLTDSGMFCGLTNSTLGKVAAIYAAILMIPTIGVQCVIAAHIYRNWHGFFRNNVNALATVVRLGLFTLFGVVGVIVSMINLSNKANSSVVNILESLPPVSFVFIFGFQKDLFRAWMLWRQRPMMDSSRSSVHNSLKRLWSGPTRPEQQTYSTADVELELELQRPWSATKVRPPWAVD